MTRYRVRSIIVLITTLSRCEADRFGVLPLVVLHCCTAVVSPVPPYTPLVWTAFTAWMPIYPAGFWADAPLLPSSVGSKGWLVSLCRCWPAKKSTSHFQSFFTLPSFLAFELPLRRDFTSRPPGPDGTLLALSHCPCLRQYHTTAARLSTIFSCAICCVCCLCCCRGL